MKKEEKLLTEICRAYLDERDIPALEELDWKELFKLAKHHNILGICYCVLNKSKYKNNIPQGFFNAIRDKFFDYVYIYECQKNALDEVEDILSSSQVRYILFKGAVLRNLYPVPESRAMGDIDLLIDRENRDKVKALLTNAGFDCTGQIDPVYNYRKGNVLLEVHTHIISEFGDSAFNDAFENAVFDGYKGTLNSDYHLAYLIAHAANHLLTTGAGVRFILDLAVLQRASEIDYDRLFDMLEKINLTTFGKALLSLCSKWFSVGRDFGTDTEKLEEYLVGDGVFGSLKSSKSFTVSRLIQIKALGEDDKEFEKSSFRLKLRLAFPSYKALRTASYIKFLDKRPYLLPLAWVYRFFYNLKNHRHHMLETIKNIDDEKTASLAKEELEFLKEIGLK